MLLLDPNNNYGSDSNESLLPDERDSFVDEGTLAEPAPLTAEPGSNFQAGDSVKQFAKDQAIKRLNRPIDRKLGKLGQQAGLSPESLAALSSDTEQNRNLLKEEAKKRARKYASDKIGSKIGDESFRRGFEKGLSKGAGDIAKDAGKSAVGKAGSAAKGAKTTATAAKGAKTTATGVKGVQAAVTVAGVVSGPETLGLGFIAALLLNIAISLGIGEAIDCLVELKHGNIAKAHFHALKAIMLIVGFIFLLITAILCLTFVGAIIGIPLLILLNIYAILGAFFPNLAQLQGLSRKWMLAILVLLNLWAIGLIMLIFTAIIFGICTQTTIGSMLGYGGIVGDAINYIDSSRFGTGGYISTLNQICQIVK
ncbi:MAG TPA: hypothetical protein PKD79_00700 [Candidatus Doudnabacteria bacterium]|nr:hypothetical protein [Candidatus Doudnabacteria bacterium]